MRDINADDAIWQAAAVCVCILGVFAVYGYLWNL